MAETTPGYLGIDVSKQWLDIILRHRTHWNPASAS
jgi:hypothetical protein